MTRQVNDGDVKLLRLCDGMSVTELVVASGLPRSTLSYRLRALRAGGYVHSEAVQDGRIRRQRYHLTSKGEELLSRNRLPLTAQVPVARARWRKSQK